MVNTHRVDEGMHTAGRSAVMNAAKRMGPIGSREQESYFLAACLL